MTDRSLEPPGPHTQSGTGSRRASIHDVAAAAGVSSGTVSNYFNHPDLLAEGTRLAVEQAVRELRYQPNPAARELRVGRSSVLGLVVLDLSNPFYTELAAAIERVALDAGCNLLVANSANDPARERRAIEALAERLPQGLLVATPISTSWLPGVEERGVTVVLVDSSVSKPGVASIAVDDRIGGELATRHLLELGHRRVGLLSGPDRLRPFAERREGLLRAMREAGLESDRGAVVVSVEPTLEGGRAGMRGLLAARDRVTGVVCANDVLATGALQILHEQGIGVPDRISLVGYDDIAIARMVSPPLTTVRQPIAEMGTIAAGFVLSPDGRAEGDRPTRTEPLVLIPELVTRASTAPPP